MIDYKKCLEFGLEHNIDQEELFLMYGLYIKDQQLMPEIYGQMREYYSQHKDNRYVDKVLKLEEKGLIEILKPLENKNSVDIKYLKITSKFTDLLFVSNKEIYWKKFRERYPQEGWMDGKIFKANNATEKDRENFEKNILKNMNRFDADNMILILESMFDWNVVKQKSEGYASVGIEKFIYNWEFILKEWQEDSSSISNYKSL